MDVRMVKVDVEEVLSDLWTRFTSDLEESERTAGSTGLYTEIFNATYEDGRACKYCLDVLRWSKLISDDECSDMAVRVDEYIENVLTKYETV